MKESEVWNHVYEEKECPFCEKEFDHPLKFNVHFYQEGCEEYEEENDASEVILSDELEENLNDHVDKFIEDEVEKIMGFNPFKGSYTHPTNEKERAVYQAIDNIVEDYFEGKSDKSVKLSSFHSVPIDDIEYRIDIVENDLKGLDWNVIIVKTT